MINPRNAEPAAPSAQSDPRPESSLVPMLIVIGMIGVMAFRKHRPAFVTPLEHAGELGNDRNSQRKGISL